MRRGPCAPSSIACSMSPVRDGPVMVAPEHARMVMQAYTAADLSAEINEPVDLPLSNQSIATINDLKGAKALAG